MKASEARLKANAKYDAANTTGFYIKLNNVHDADIIERLQAEENKQGYVKALIRQDIEGSKVDRKS